MKSTITKLYDRSQYQPGDQLRRWRVSQQQIQAKLDKLCADHAGEMDVEIVCAGDSVACRGESQSPLWNRPLLLFYPGHGLCDKALEDAILGMTVGESKTVSTAGIRVTLTVTRIVRRVPSPLTDELVRLEKMEGVDTVEAYKTWYRKTTEEANREQALHAVIKDILRTITENSEVSIDPEEESAWCKAAGDYDYDRDVRAGDDPTIPEEGIEFLTEEQARQKYYEEMKPYFRAYAVNWYLLETLWQADPETICRDGIREMAENSGMTVEKLMETTEPCLLRELMVRCAVQDRLAAEAEKYLED